MVIKEVKEEETKKSPVKLEDFELVRVLGKGCAGRVSFTAISTTRAQAIYPTYDRFTIGI